VLFILFPFISVISLACDIERVWGSLGFVGQMSRRQNTSESVRERLSLARLDCTARSFFVSKNWPRVIRDDEWFARNLISFAFDWFMDGNRITKFTITVQLANFRTCFFFFNWNYDNFYFLKNLDCSKKEMFLWNIWI
jgi:hypothetical protein